MPKAEPSGVDRSGAAGGGAIDCTGVREGWMARSKVLFMLSWMYATFGASKRWLFKLDADTLIHPFHLHPLLASLSFLPDTSEPILLGLASCRSERQPELCHPAGGAGYALSSSAARLIHAMVHRGVFSLRRVRRVRRSAASAASAARRSALRPAAPGS